MFIQKSSSKLSATLLALILGASVFMAGQVWAAKYVTDPTTGKVVSAPEYGGTFTFAVQRERPTTDPLFGGNVDGVAEKMGMVNWGTDRDVYDLTGAFSYFPESVLTGRLAES